MKIISVVAVPLLAVVIDARNIRAVSLSVGEENSASIAAEYTDTGTLGKSSTEAANVATLKRLEALEAAERDTLLKQQATLEALVADEHMLTRRQQDLEERQILEILESKNDTEPGMIKKFLEDPFNSTLVVEARTQAESPETRLAALAVHFALLVLIAVIYRNVGAIELPEKLVHDARHGEFEHGLCSCLDARPALNFWACCCSPIRWADTMSSPPNNWISFWVGFVLFEVLVGLNPGTGLFFLALVVYGRYNIRKTYGMKTTAGTCCVDTLVWSFCSCCAIVQEARQVEEMLPTRPVEPPV